jgi:hypothetical protein
MKVLIVLTSHDTLINTGRRTGWLQELALLLRVQGLWHRDRFNLAAVASPSGSQQ